jgi:hypothetical protein
MDIEAPENGGPQTPETQDAGAGSRDATLQALYPDDVPTDEAAVDDKDVDAAAIETGQDDQTAPAVPEDYAGLRMPEGTTMDVILLNDAAPVLREAGVNRDQLQKLLPVVTKVQERVLEDQNNEWAAIRAQWARETHADREIGGANFKETRRLAAIALEAGGAKSMNHPIRELLNESGLGNNRAFLRVFRNIGKVIEKYRRNESVATHGKPKSREQILYPDG